MTRLRNETVHPLSDIGPDLLTIEKPARYLGGEYGSIRKDKEGLFTVALCFPDLYEIGMSNNAIRILYQGLNALSDVRCERVFTPAADFSALLTHKGLPLYTLESGIPLNAVDMIGFSIGYELCATNILATLDSGMVPLLGKDRTTEDPIVVAGGPAITNPHPFSMFLDAVYIGEAEAGFYDVVSRLAALKRSGAVRQTILEKLREHPAVWSPASKDTPANTPHRKAVRALFSGFKDFEYSTALPLATTKTVQDHGTVEIMRGCPNGCRFCHAGYFYRPQRIKSPDAIFAEIERLVALGGYREITLASLSSGDYPGIGKLVSELNRRWTKRRVSFQLPSLKIDTFTLPLLESLSEIRKSGLTFAVETPVESWQASINKPVSFDRTVAILDEANKRGFRQAKFYFMIGLPVDGFGEGEAAAIIAFLEKICCRTTLSLSVNVGTFVPKPHTPFERSSQLSEEASLSALSAIKNNLKRFRNVKISYHSPFVSMLEGVISRGSDAIGELLLDAYKKGARLDAWEEHFNRELWRSVLCGAPDGLISNILSAKDPEENLPWKDVSLRVSTAYLKSESEKSRQGILTLPCAEYCKENCGSCGDDAHIVDNSAQWIPSSGSNDDRVGRTTEIESSTVDSQFFKRHWIVFSYVKTGIAAFYQHLSIVEFFSRAFMMHGIPIAFSEGFNPMPRIETTPPLTMGAESDCEIMQVPLDSETVDLQNLVVTLNASLPSGIMIIKARERQPQPEGIRHRSLGSLYHSSEYCVQSIHEDEQLAVSSIDRLCIVLARLGIVVRKMENAISVTFSLDDKSGGDRNLVRLLEKATESRPALTDFRVRRLRSYLLDNNFLQDLYTGI